MHYLKNRREQLICCLKLKCLRRVIPCFVTGLAALYVYWSLLGGRIFIFNFISQYRNPNTHLTVDRQSESLNGQTKIILVWTTWFGGVWLSKPSLANEGLFVNADMPAPGDPPVCLVTTNRTMINEASAVIFHGLDIKRFDMPPRRSDQRFVLFNMEPPENIEKAIDWPFMSSMRFNWTMSYSERSDITTRYWRTLEFDERIMRDPQFKADISERISNFSNNFSTRKYDAIWIVSHCRTESKREYIVDELRRSGFKIGVYGRCSGKSFDEVLYDYGDDIFKDYRFYLAFENAICTNYSTEKSERALVASQRHGVIPVVYGGADYWKIMPVNSFIDLRQFSDLADFVRVAKYYSQPQNKGELPKFFEWQYSYVIDGLPFVYHAFSATCDKLWKSRNINSQYHAELNYTSFSNCTAPLDFRLNDQIYYFPFFSSFQNFKIFVEYHTLLFCTFSGFSLFCLSKGILFFLRSNQRMRGFRLGNI